MNNEQQHSYAASEQSAESATGGASPLSRRKMLATIGVAGAAIATGGWLGGGLAASASVQGAVYGDGSCCEPAALTVAELRTMAGPAPARVRVLGYYAANDGGGGLFYWDAASSAADNGGTVIQPTGVASGRWIRLV